MTQTITNILQWFCIGIGFLPAIIYLFNPRLIRRLFQTKVKYFKTMPEGHSLLIEGYLIQYVVRTDTMEQPDTTMKVSTAKPAKMIAVQKEIVYAIVEPSMKIKGAWVHDILHASTIQLA